VADDSERDNALFVNLILIFQSAAMQQMGKIMNPITGEVEKNLEQARFSIDTLAMLRGKTRGNLSSDLERLLDSTLLQLRMNFVEESRAEEEAHREEARTPTAGEEKSPEERSAAAGNRMAEDRAARDKDLAGEVPAEDGHASDKPSEVTNTESEAAGTVTSAPEADAGSPLRKHGGTESGRTRRKGRPRGEGRK
jgi:hypothetical protein